MLDSSEMDRNEELSSLDFRVFEEGSESNSIPGSTASAQVIRKYIPKGAFVWFFEVFG
jgi:hypothetical protein